jgi:hypothetical protein
LSLRPPPEATKKRYRPSAFQAAQMTSSAITAKRARLLPTGRGGRWPLPLLSALLSPYWNASYPTAEPAAMPEFFGRLPSFRRVAASFEGGSQFFAQLGGCQDQNIVPGAQSGVTFDGDKLAVPHNEADPSVAWEVG